MNVYGIAPTTTAYEIALNLYYADLGGIEDVNRHRDDNGNPTLTRIDFADGSILIVGEEDDKDGNLDGVTWSVYLDEEELEARAGAVDGSPNLKDLGDVIRDMAANATGES